MCLALVLDADGVELVVVDVVLTGGAVHVALLQLYPEPVPGRLDVLSHVGTPAGKVDALEAGVQSGCTPEVSRQCAINLAIVCQKYCGAEPVTVVAVTSCSFLSASPRRDRCGKPGMDTSNHCQVTVILWPMHFKQYRDYIIISAKIKK